MPKNLVRESIRHHVLLALTRVREAAPSEEFRAWEEVCQTFDITYAGDGSLLAVWSKPRPGQVPINRKTFEFYRRGDRPDSFPGDDPFAANLRAADAVVTQISVVLELARSGVSDVRLRREMIFHDEWASSVGSEHVMVRQSFEACTAPEHRLILRLLGDLNGKRLLDLGSGLGEASVYFALKGAWVTACDLSSGMLEIAARVAAHHGVTMDLHCAPAEKTGLPEGSFDIVYAGNLLHHVDVPAALDEIHRVLRPGGVFVTWDPLAHNPFIHVYRRLARAVRTLDEHPLKISDLGLFRARFQDVQWRCFWLLTLAVFLRFYLWERVHPSQERYWKKILVDEQRISSFYRRLEGWDDRMLSFVPWLSRYCWNIVIWGRK